MLSYLDGRWYSMCMISSLSSIVFPHSVILCCKCSKFVIHMSGSSFFSFVTHSVAWSISSFWCYYVQRICRTVVSMPMLWCRSSDPYPLPCPQFWKIRCLECRTVVGLHRLLCSFCSCCIVFLIWRHVSQNCQLLGCFATWYCLQSYQYAMISAYHCLNQKSLVPCVPFCLFSFPRNLMYTFLKCFIICLVRHCLCFFLLLIKSFLLTVVWLLPLRLQMC